MTLILVDVVHGRSVLSEAFVWIRQQFFISNLAILVEREGYFFCLTSLLC